MWQNPHFGSDFRVCQEVRSPLKCQLGPGAARIPTASLWADFQFYHQATLAAQPAEGGF